MDEFNPDINEHQLDKEWLKFPRVYYQWSVKLADARRDMEVARRRSDLLKAELGSDIRNDPVKYGIGKVTETAIEAAILGQPLYTKAIESYATQRHNVEVIQAAVSALDMKKAALEGMVKLLALNYYSTPRASDEATRETADEITRSSIRGVRQRNKEEEP